MRRPAIWFAAALLLASCQSSTPPPRANTAPGGGAGAAPATWITFLHDPQRSGHDDAQPVMARPHALWTTGVLDGEIFASPLAYEGLALVATENDTIYAFDLTTGKQRWMRHLGDPFPASSLPCGDVGPTVGITSTPVIDTRALRLYAVGMLASGEYHLYGVDLSDGHVTSDRRLDMHGLDPKVENQRGALALDRDRVLIPFGGRAGDCGQYHGLVLGEPIGSGTSEVLYRVPSGREAGIWTPGGETVADDGTVWVATGNSDAARQYDQANSVLELSADLALEDSFAPSDWAALSRTDTDLGSSTPTLVGDLVFLAGKSGVGYLLRQAHLGGVAGDLFAQHVCAGGYGQAIYGPPYLYVPCSDGLVGLTVDQTQPRFDVAWHSQPFRAGSPIEVGERVWVLDVDGGVLYGLEPESGHVSAQVTTGTANHFVTPAAGGGCVLVPAKRQLTAVGDGPGC